MQIRRIKDGFADLASNETNSCLAYNEWDLDTLIQNNKLTTNLAHEFIKKYDKTLLVGKTKEEELESMNRKYSSYLVDGKRTDSQQT